MNVLNKIPFLRIIIPFIAGILVAQRFNFLPVELPLNIALIGVLVVCLASAIINSNLKKFTLLLADLFLGLLAIKLVCINTINYQPNHYTRQVKSDSAFYALAMINDLPLEKKYAYKCELLLKQIKTETEFKSSSGIIIAYLKKNSACNLKAGNTLLLKFKLNEIENPKNPNEFNYKQYLANKQIFHTAYVDSLSYIVLTGTTGLNPVLDWGLRAKFFIIERLKNSNLNQTSYSICNALITGYDAEVDQAVTEAFSHSGTLHVLSVSGLHTGLIYMLINFILGLIDRRNKYKILRFTIISLLLWTFALITGFSAPVLRAVIMFNLFGLGKLFFRNNYYNQLNILLVSAFILLMYNPFLLTDVGFILSYTALGGIIYFQPLLVNSWQPSAKFLVFIWQSVTTSVAATIGTLPVTLLYFKQFPFWFFISNLVVVPLTFVLLLLAFMIVLKAGFLSGIVNYLIHFLLGFMNLFNNSKTGYVDEIDFNFTDACFLTLIVISFTVAIQNRAYQQFAISFMLLISWQCYSIYNSWVSKKHSLFVCYNIRKENTCLVKNNTKVILNTNNNRSYNYHIKGHITSFNNSDKKVENFNYINFSNNNVLILNKKDSLPRIIPANINYLIVANNFILHKKTLSGFKSLKMVVYDASNNKYNIANAEELCCKFGIAFYSTQSEGAFLMPLK